MSKLQIIGNWFRAQWQGIVASLFLAFVSFFGVYLSGAMNREDAAARVRIEQFQAIADQQEEFNALLQAFTEKVSSVGQPDPELVSDLTANLGHQYSKVGTFAGNLGEEGSAVVTRYRTALNNVKTDLQRLRTVADLDPLGVSLIEMYRSQKELTPLMLKATGQPVSPGPSS